MKNNLLLRRIMRGYTQEQMAKEMRNNGEDCTQSDISLYESGNRIPTMSRILVMSKVLKCPVEELYSLSDNDKDTIQD